MSGLEFKYLGSLLFLLGGAYNAKNSMDSKKQRNLEWSVALSYLAKAPMVQKLKEQATNFLLIILTKKRTKKLIPHLYIITFGR